MSNTTTLGALLEEYEQQELTLLPLAEYEVEIVSVTPRKTDIIPAYKVVSGPYAGKRTMGGTISCNGNAAPRFFARMREAGLGKEWFKTLGAEGLPVAEVMKAVADALKGRIVVASFTIEEPNKYHDEPRNRLEKFSRLVAAPAQAQVGVPVIQAAAPVIGVATPAAPAAPVAPPQAPVVEVASVAAPAAPIVEQQSTIPAAPAPGVPVIAAPVAAAPVAPPEAPPPVVVAEVAAPAPASVVQEVATPVVALTAAPAETPAAAAAPVAATIQVADEPDF